MGRRRKGQAAVIGGIIMLAIIFSVVLPLIIFHQRSFQYVSSQAEIEARFLEERRKESLNVWGRVDITGGNPVIEAENVGSIPVTVERIWLFNESGMTLKYIVNLASVSNSVVESITVNGVEWDVFGRGVPVLQPGDRMRAELNITGSVELVFYLESDRGVMHPRDRAAVFKSGQVSENPSEYLGPLRVVFLEFRWYRVKKNGTCSYLENYPAGNNSFNVPVGDDVAFGVVLMNAHPDGKGISLSEGSHAWLLAPRGGGKGLGQPSVAQWYIVNVDENGILLEEYNEVYIPWNSSMLVIFASDKAGGFSGPVRITGGVEGKVGYLNILLTGVVEDRPFSQNIPFIGIFLVEE